jgi:hypothetical protein
MQSMLEKLPSVAEVANGSGDVGLDHGRHRAPEPTVKTAPQATVWNLPNISRPRAVH